MKHNSKGPLQLILVARDQRDIRKKKLALEGFSCMSLSLNVPGFPKSNSTAKHFFRLCLKDLRYFLKSHLIEISDKGACETQDDAGNFFIAPLIPGPLCLSEIKQICENFEEGHVLGRFIDVDLNDSLGNTVSSGKSKFCFYCGTKPAIECRRLKTHDPELLRSFMFTKMAEYCRQKRENIIAKKISVLALKAILTEISLTPKPGLVDKFSNGSHDDMNFQTFIDSSAAISGGFCELVHAGFSFHENDRASALPVIRNIGLRMESAMYEATKNINTQRGIIFLMGLSLFCCGMLYRDNDHFEIELFRGVIKDICKNLVRKELGGFSRKKSSHGEDIFNKYGVSGARGEAESGFRMVFEYGLPQLSRVTNLNDEAMINCFLAIASNISDTNILYRRGPEVLLKFQNHCKFVFENFNNSNYATILEFCKSENISPGGSADLLAVSIFIWSVIKADNRADFSTLLLNHDF